MFTSDRVCGVKLTSNEFQSLCFLCILLPSINCNQDVYSSYLDALFGTYDTCCENYITIIGGDFDVDINNDCFCTEGRYFVDYLNENNLCSVPLRQSLTCNDPLYTYRSQNYNVKTLIDYVCIPECVSNDLLLVKVCSDCSYNVSDDDLVCIHLNIVRVFTNACHVCASKFIT